MFPVSIADVLEVDAPQGSPAPVVLDSPHSGTVYPADFGTVLPPSILRRAEDMYIDVLYEDAPALGMAFLKALFPRCYIDANRAEEDLDPAMLNGPWDGPLNPGTKAALGIGLIWAKAPPDGRPFYDRKLSVAEALARITRYHRPYHAALQALIDQTQGRFGAVWHVNCHSMPGMSNETSPEGPGIARPDFNLGDRDGTTCASEFTAFCKERLEKLGYGVVVNVPYKGVELVRRHGLPAKGRQSIQIEISRTLYMDEDSFARTEGFVGLKADLHIFLEELAEWSRRRLPS